MVLDVDTGTLVGAGATLIAAFWALGRMLIAQSGKAIENQFGMLP